MTVRRPRLVNRPPEAGHALTPGDFGPVLRRYLCPAANDALSDGMLALLCGDLGRHQAEMQAAAEIDRARREDDLLRRLSDARGAARRVLRDPLATPSLRALAERADAATSELMKELAPVLAPGTGVDWKQATVLLLWRAYRGLQGPFRPVGLSAGRAPEGSQASPGVLFVEEAARRFFGLALSPAAIVRRVSDVQVTERRAV